MLLLHSKMYLFNWILYIASAKSRSARGASHQPAFMNSCLTISHTCLTFLPSGGTLPFWSDLFVVGWVVIWERWESTELERWESGEGSDDDDELLLSYG